MQPQEMFGLVCLGLIVLWGIGWLVGQVAEYLAAAASSPRLDMPKAPETPRPTLAPTAAPAPSYAPVVQAARETALQLHELHAARRQHTLIASRPGDGKTTALNTLEVADIEQGHQAIVCNPQFAYYHPDDQPIDLRPIRDRFELATSYAAIEQTLRSVYALVEPRNALYRDGLPVGHHISVIVDEWPAIVESDYGESCIKLVQKLVREARKCNIWVTLAAQDGQIATLGFKSGLRASFLTRLVGNVDSFSWKALIGDRPQVPVQRGTWASEAGMIQVQRPTAETITALAAKTVKIFDAMPVPLDSAIARNRAADSGLAVDSIAWAERAKDLTREGLSTRQVLRAIGGDYNEIVRLAREAREEIER